MVGTTSEDNRPAAASTLGEGSTAGVTYWRWKTPTRTGLQSSTTTTMQMWQRQRAQLLPERRQQEGRQLALALETGRGGGIPKEPGDNFESAVPPVDTLQKTHKTSLLLVLSIIG